MYRYVIQLDKYDINLLILRDKFKDVYENKYGVIANGILVKKFFLQTDKWIFEIIRELKVNGRNK